MRQRPVGAQAGGVRVGGFRGQPQQIAAHGGQVQCQGVVPAEHTAIGGVEALLAVRLVHAAPSTGLGVQHQLCAAGELEVQGELFVGVVLRVHDAEQVLPAPLAQPCVHALGAAFVCHPLKAVRVVLAIVEGGLGGVGAAQSGKVLLEGIVEGVFQ